LTAMISLWIAANPVKVSAANASVDCADGTTRTCEAAGASCFAHDPDDTTHGYCECTAGGQQVALKTCDGDPPDPPYLD
jgi:hypothetical protein